MKDSELRVHRIAQRRILISAGSGDEIPDRGKMKNGVSRVYVLFVCCTASPVIWSR